jgi:hypothetical protein
MAQPVGAGAPSRSGTTAPTRQAAAPEPPARTRDVPRPEEIDTVLLHAVPAWSQPAGPLHREPPRNDPPRTDLVSTAFGVTEPSAGVIAASSEEPTEVVVAPRALVFTETVAEVVIETVIVETMPRGDA